MNRLDEIRTRVASLEAVSVDDAIWLVCEVDRLTTQRDEARAEAERWAWRAVGSEHNPIDWDLL